MDAPWWQRGVFYQIYPRSFMDGNGDGVGDLPGITSRLDYLVELGVDALWLSPCFRSPMADFGYDISDYCSVDPLFGDNAEMGRLIAAAHERGLRVVLDLVPNHTSDRHPWFVESRSSRTSARRDWYIWHDGGGPTRPPNNWVASFGGPAWTWDAPSGQWYLHSFLAEQPDLNWRNPAVREAMLDVMRFWLDRGVDGFRIDAIQCLVKDDQLRDNPARLHIIPFFRQRHVYDLNRPEVHEILRSFRRLLEGYPGERMAVGETFLWDPAEVASYYGNGRDELHLAFNFRLLFCPWWAGSFRRVVDRFEELLPPGAWPAWTLSNHDQTRHITRYGRTGRAEQRARLAALLLLTLRGTPFVYYGEEIGMRSHRLPRARLVDPVGKRYWPFHPGRDVARTPMQWNGDPGGGFTSGEPWLPLPPDAPRIHVAAQRDDPRSLLSLYRRLIAFRRGAPALQQGSYRSLGGLPGGCYAFLRLSEEQRLLIVLNFSRRGKTVSLAAAAAAVAEAGGASGGAGEARLALSTDVGRATGERPGEWLRLGPEEGVILEL